MKLTGEQVGQFFDAKRTGTYKCPVCSNEEFVVNGGGGDNELLVALFEFADPKVKNSAHSFYSIDCTNCGHTTFFNERAIAAWLKSKGSAKDG